MSEMGQSETLGSERDRVPLCADDPTLSAGRAGRKVPRAEVELSIRLR